MERGSWKFCTESFPGGRYVVGRGAPLPLPKAPRAAAKRRKRAGGQGWETLTLAGLGQGLGAPFFSFLSYFP
jgi:hypothetical protein